jgi:hypothetical protein
MNQSDEIREFCKKNYIDPARLSGVKTVRIRAGNVHDGLKYMNRHSAVCSALGTPEFETMCNVKKIAMEGHVNTEKTVFVYELL